MADITDRTQENGILDGTDVYVAERCYDYEGCTVIGVFTSHGQAEEACENDRYANGEKRGNSHEITKRVMNRASYGL